MKTGEPEAARRASIASVASTSSLIASVGLLARVPDGREFVHERHTETAREALKSWFKGVRREGIVFLGIRQYAGTMSLRMVGA
jgi:hypothetical protein